MGLPLAKQLARTHRKPNAYARVWIPSQAQIDATVRRFFAASGDDFECVRVKTVGLAVSAALGAVWSPAIGLMIRSALERMGGRLILFCNKRLVAGIRPRHFDRAEAVALSMTLRNRKKLPPDHGKL